MLSQAVLQGVYDVESAGSPSCASDAITGHQSVFGEFKMTHETCKFSCNKRDIHDRTAFINESLALAAAMIPRIP